MHTYTCICVYIYVCKNFFSIIYAMVMCAQYMYIYYIHVHTHTYNIYIIIWENIYKASNIRYFRFGDWKKLELRIKKAYQTYAN